MCAEMAAAHIWKQAIAINSWIGANTVTFNALVFKADL